MKTPSLNFCSHPNFDTTGTVEPLYCGHPWGTTLWPLYKGWPLLRGCFVHKVFIWDLGAWPLCAVGLYSGVAVKRGSTVISHHTAPPPPPPSSGVPTIHWRCMAPQLHPWTPLSPLHTSHTLRHCMDDVAAKPIIPQHCWSYPTVLTNGASLSNQLEQKLLQSL